MGRNKSLNKKIKYTLTIYDDKEKTAPIITKDYTSLRKICEDLKANRNTAYKIYKNKFSNNCDKRSVKFKKMSISLKKHEEEKPNEPNQG